VQAPAVSRKAFVVLAWGLAFHSLIIAVLFGLLEMPENTVRMIAAWKEIALACFLLIVAVRSVLGRGPGVALTWTDLWVAGIVLTALMYFAGANLWLRAELPLNAQLLGFRQAVYFMLIYFVGRATPGLADDDKTMRQIFLLIIVTSVLGILERFLLPPEGLVALGVASYFQDFLGASAMTAGNEYGLPTNYWAFIGNTPVRRAGSIYLNGQAFAVPFLLFFPLATAWVFARARRSSWAVFAYSIMCVALLLTLTRMTIIVALIQLVLFILLRRRPEWAVAGLAVAAAMFLIVFVVVPGFPEYFFLTLSGQETSAASHIRDVSKGVLAFLEQPWGTGLGTTDASATRARLQHVTGDNLYLKYAVEMGIVGISLLVLMFGSFIAHSYNLFRRGTSEPQRRMGATIWLATIGLAINGMTAVVFNSLILGWLFFWLAGAVVSQSQRLTAPAPAPSELRLAAAD